MRFCTKSDVGRVRKSNQDSVIAKDGLFGVADGMGGCNGGETASRMAIETVSGFLEQKEPDCSVLTEALSLANRKIYETAQKTPSLSGMGTTFSLLWESADQIRIAHVGDSRIYRLRDGKLTRITQDHSLVAELVRNKLITEQMARIHPYRNVITKALGVDPSVEADILTEERKVGDLWLICSDGLHGLVEDDCIESILSEAVSLEEAAEKLLQKALEAGGTDNVSLVLCKDEGKESSL